MALSKITFKPGVNRENTRYTNEGGWYESEKIRFRQGTPEKIGGWQRLSTSTFVGACRSLWNWVTLGSLNLMGVGTNLKFYIESGGIYNDITPLRATVALGVNPFTTTNGLATVVVTDAAGGFTNNDFVTFSGATAVGGLTIVGEYQLTVITVTTYQITASSNATSTATGGGASVVAAYQINTGPCCVIPLVGWGAGAWGTGTWGTGTSSVDSIRLWNQNNFGQNLVFGPRGKPLYYWDATGSITTRGVLVSSLGGASNVPLYQNSLSISDTSRFVLVFGTNAIGSGTLDPMLIRWSDQESVVNWTPAITNQAGSIRLSHGSTIVTTLQSRQEILVFTDSTLYSMQYLGAPLVWGTQLLSDNISIAGQNTASIASGVVYWMGVDKFYKYDGRVQTLRCDLRQYIYGDINLGQISQSFSSSNEGFNEIWWFYCSAASTTVDRYVIYNYFEDVWYYGTMARTAWIDSGLRNYPMAATYSQNLVYHEYGINDNETAVELPIAASVLSSEFDIGDGNNFGFVWRMLPDITFRGSTIDAPLATMTLYPLINSGSGYTNPASVSGVNYANVVRSTQIPVEKFTGQVYTRLRGRQMAFKIESNQVGNTWQIGSPRIDIKPDGRASGKGA